MNDYQKVKKLYQKQIFTLKMKTFKKALEHL